MIEIIISQWPEWEIIHFENGGWKIKLHKLCIFLGRAAK